MVHCIDREIEAIEEKNILEEVFAEVECKVVQGKQKTTKKTFQYNAI